MQALAAGKLDEALQIDGGEPLAHVARGCNDVGPVDAVARIDIADDAVANIQMIDGRAAHMQFEHARLHQRKQTFEVLVIAFAVSAAIFGAVRLAAPISVVIGISRTTSRGGLSSRTPLNAAWRTIPSAVQPRRFASITVLGSTQRTSRRRASAGGI